MASYSVHMRSNSKTLTGEFNPNHVLEIIQHYGKNVLTLDQRAKFDKFNGYKDVLMRDSYPMIELTTKQQLMLINRWNKQGHGNYAYWLDI